MEITIRLSAEDARRLIKYTEDQRAKYDTMIERFKNVDDFETVKILTLSRPLTPEDIVLREILFILEMQDEEEFYLDNPDN